MTISDDSRRALHADHRRQAVFSCDHCPVGHRSADLGPADRLNETLELIQFLRDETQAMMRRWQEHKATLGTRRNAQHD